MVGNFHDRGMPAKSVGAHVVSRQTHGIEWQLDRLSRSTVEPFCGMVTDSRSFMSFPRHEYFRRVLCNLTQ